MTFEQTLEQIDAELDTMHLIFDAFDEEYSDWLQIADDTDHIIVDYFGE